MTTSYLLGGHIPLTDSSVQEFYDRYPEIRRSYEETAEWTGVSVPELLEGGRHTERELLHAFDGLRQAALVLGLHDVLAARGVHPDAVGGISLGGLLSACLAGAVDRRELFEMLHYHRLVPPQPAGTRAQGMAVAALRFGDDPEDYYGERRPGVYLAADYDAAYGGDVHVIVLSGYVDALEELVAQHPRRMQMLDEYPGAFHSPLAQYATDFMAPHIAGMTFRDPKITLFSPHVAGAVTTADEVRDFFLYNHVRPVGVKPLMTEVERIGTTAVVGLGPGLPQSLVVEPLTMTLILTPGELDEAAEALR
ncbi:acyltransferase domain-containing protein [Nocardia sp. NPDC004860]|uniref:acyltransferase domain-containing protein n=1 Tax=Nocardia sp. NPDC004860 TaxID=3154557 RepID=UPI0033B506DE